MEITHSRLETKPIPQVHVDSLRVPPTIALGYIRGHEVAGRFTESLVDALLFDLNAWKQINGRVVKQFCAHYLNEGRNALVREFLDNPAYRDAEILVSLDTDQTFKPEQVLHLAELVDAETRPVVSGLYYACDYLGEQVRPVMLRRRADGALVSDWEFKRGTLVDVDVVGMGFCAIHRSVLERMRELAGDTWYDFDETERGAFMPEDNAFCRRVKEYLGLPIVVHTGIVVGHLKCVELTERSEKRKG